MLLALALTTLLAADEPGPSPPSAPLAATDVPQAEPVSDDGEVNQTLLRMGTTALGGAVGIALPLLVGYGFQSQQAPCARFMFGCMRDGPMAGAAMFLPATVAVGLGVGHSARGGRSGVGFGLLGGLSGYMVSVATLGLVSLASSRDWARSYPGAGAGIIAATSLVGSVAAMELRHTALLSGAKEWSTTRSLATAAVFWLPFALLEALIIAGSIASNSPAVASIVPVFGTIANLGLSSLAAWGVHRVMGGRGSYFATLAGALISTTVGVGFIALHAHGPPNQGIFPVGAGGTTSWAMVPVFTVGALIALAGPAIALEWTNGNAPETPKREEPPPPGFGDNLQVQGGFGPGGGTIGLSGTF